MKQPTRVLIIDDSPFICRLLANYLESAADVTVVGTANDGVTGLAQIRQLRPDVVTLDVEMPQMDGLATLEHIMHDMPVPVLMISGISRRSARLSLRAMELGAVDFTLKYTPQSDTNPETLRKEILAKVRAAAQVKVVRSVRPRSLGDSASGGAAMNGDPLPSRAQQPPLESYSQASRLPGGVLVIGASTGGPVAVRELLSQLPIHFPAAIILVQHMPATFTNVLATQLNNSVALNVREAQMGDRLRPGQVLIAPGDYHLLVRPDSRVYLNQADKIMGHRPSINVTMQSVAQAFGHRTRGVLLTGMGEDGVLGLVAIRSKGGQSYAQNAETCVVDGMPQRARELGLADFVGTPAQIAQRLREEMAVDNEWQMAAEMLSVPLI
ncbi:MAG: chemotaxis-specific protein-glutamate methyltransferase CheB [Anaerolineales bacterium]|nr:chemotaxis-specific protein-glutamate methyltransferase CheB [Anaerolineales bacterium]MCB9431282.1 chemotaxis-specific protein-glutamate methyltransferase CheB [Ardenticatenaceae bacterium]